MKKPNLASIYEIREGDMLMRNYDYKPGGVVLTVVKVGQTFLHGHYYIKTVQLKYTQWDGIELVKETYTAENFECEFFIKVGKW